jgi:DNA polymerase elongation subunit (family B)
MYLTREQIESTAHLSSRQAARQLGVGKTSVSKYRKRYADPEREIELPNARVLIIDIESRPGQYYSWGPKAEWLASPMMINPGGMMCFAAKWLGEKDTMFFAEWHKDHESMVYAAHSLLSQADIVVTYNGDRYDLKRLNNEFLEANLAPPRPYRSIDLFKTNRQKFDLPYKKLDYLAQVTGTGEKVKHEGFGLWVGAMAGDPEARAKMEEYNIGDVELTERVYVKLLPWLATVPHMGMFVFGQDGECPYCGGTVAATGQSTNTHVQTYELFQCTNCEGWSRGNKPIGTTLETRRIV